MSCRLLSGTKRKKSLLPRVKVYRTRIPEAESLQGFTVVVVVASLADWKSKQQSCCSDKMTCTVILAGLLFQCSAKKRKKKKRKKNSIFTGTVERGTGESGETGNVTEFCEELG